MKTYKITGTVFGNLWGGGKGAYPAETLQGNNLEKLKKEANKLLKNGLLDSGMGYENLIGAYLIIETITTKTINGKKFINSECDNKFIGKLSEKEKDFLQFECT